MRGAAWLRAGGMAMVGASVQALLGWWGVALIVGAYLVALGFAYELRATMLQRHPTTWDGLRRAVDAERHRRSL